MFQKILVALDESENSKSVFEQAIGLAEAANAQLMLLHVLSPVDEQYPDLTSYSTGNLHYPSLYREMFTTQLDRWSHYEQASLEKLRALAAEAESVGVKAEFTQNLGSPGRTICAIAHTWNADLIMVGRRGHSGLSELLLGSVSNYVLHHAPCSVLTVQHLPIPSSEVEPKSQVQGVA